MKLWCYFWNQSDYVAEHYVIQIITYRIYFATYISAYFDGNICNELCQLQELPDGPSEKCLTCEKDVLVANLRSHVSACRGGDVSA